jgi:hypothetical protein
MTRSKAVFGVALLLLTSTTFALAGDAQSEKATPPPSAAKKAPPQDKLTVAETEAIDLMLLLDTNKDGKLSKQEWLSYMEAEFDRLDVNKDGFLDAKELRKTRVRVVHPPVGK